MNKVSRAIDVSMDIYHTSSTTSRGHLLRPFLPDRLKIQVHWHKIFQSLLKCLIDRTPTQMIARIEASRLQSNKQSWLNFKELGTYLRGNIGKRRGRYPCHTMNASVPRPCCLGIEVNRTRWSKYMLEALKVVGVSVDRLLEVEGKEITQTSNLFRNNPSQGSSGSYAQSAYTKSGHWSPATVISLFSRPSRTLQDIKTNSWWAG